MHDFESVKMKILDIGSGLNTDKDREKGNDMTKKLIMTDLER